MNARNIVIIITVLSCLALSIVLYMNLGTEGVLWLFLYGVFFQMCFALIVFTFGAFLTRKGSPIGPGLMKGAAVSSFIIFFYWIVAIGALSISRALI